VCFIQDNPEDWYLESMKMADIFQYAAMTLAATSSHGDTHGCYEEQPRDIQDVVLTLPECLGGHQLVVRPLIPHWDTTTHGSTEKHFLLLTRARVLQEGLLSRQIIHFYKLELTWEYESLVLASVVVLANTLVPEGITIKSSG
jgi:hypothetical protein